MFAQTHHYLDTPFGILETEIRADSQFGASETVTLVNATKSRVVHYAEFDSACLGSRVFSEPGALKSYAASVAHSLAYAAKRDNGFT